MTARQSSPSSDHSPHSDNSIRKRVCKACDRCRLKKSKCDGVNPCGRCRTDNAICVFGERKKAHDKVYPKGYVEMLEQQQVWLVHGLQELYRRTNDGEGWPGEPLKPEPNGHPLTHDLLTRLGALDQSKGEHFEENADVMQQELWKHHTGSMQRQASSDSSSEHAAQSPVPPRFTDPFCRHGLPPTPPGYSPSTGGPVPSIKTEPPISPASSTAAFSTAFPLPGVVDPITLQGQPWSSNGFSAFDEMELLTTSDFPGILFDDQPASSTPAFTRPFPLSCVSSASYLDTRGDCDDFNQYLNPSTMEITPV